MKRFTKGFFGLIMAAALVFTNADAGILAAAENGAAVSQQEMEEAPAGVEETTETGSQDMTAQQEEGTADEVNPEDPSGEEQEMDLTAEVKGEEVSEAELDNAALGYMQFGGITYIQEGETDIYLNGEISGSYDGSQIKEMYIEAEDGERVAINSYRYASANYDNTTWIEGRFDLYKPLTKGPYYGMVRTDGEPQVFSKVVVVDEPTVGFYEINSAYDSAGGYIALQVRGLKLGDGSGVNPALKYQGKTVASFADVTPLSTSEYLYRLKKDQSVDWTKDMELIVEFADGVTNSWQSVINWNGVYRDGELIEHAYYEGYKEKTEIQFKKHPDLKKGTAITLKLMLDDASSSYIATGTGTLDENNLLAVDLKDEGGNLFVPVEPSRVGAMESYYVDYSIGDKQYSDWVYFYRYDQGSAGGSGSYCYIVPPSQYVYTTDTTFSPVLSISSDKLKGSGDLTVQIEGNSGTLKASSGNYTGKVALGNGLAEGVHTMTVWKGTEQIGTAVVYALKKDVFYQSYQEVGSILSDGQPLKYVAFTSESLIKEHFSAKSRNSAESKKIWDSEGFRLQLFAPDGKEFTPQIDSYYSSGSYFWVYFTLPAEAESYYGLYTKITSGGNNGRYLGAQGQSYYSHEKEYRDQGGRYSDEYGYYVNLGVNLLRILPQSSQRKGSDLYDVKYSMIYELGADFPITVTFTKRNEAEPLKSFTISQSQMVGNYYYFKSADVSGLDPKEPYTIRLYSSETLMYEITGYVAAYTGKIPTVKPVKVTSVKINETDPEIVVGKTVNLTYTVEPSNASVTKVAWKSSAPKVATVDANGVVTGVSAGNAKITVTVDGKSASVNVSVIEKQIPLTGLSLEHETLSLGLLETADLGIIKEPEDATDAISCESSDPQVALVSSTGRVTGLGAGTATISVKSGELEAKCVVTVEARLEGIRISGGSDTLYVGESTEFAALDTPVNSGDYMWSAELPEDVPWSLEDYITLTEKENGRYAQITAKKAGAVLLTLTAMDKNDASNTFSDSVLINLRTSDVGNAGSISGNDPGVSGNDPGSILEALDETGKHLWISGLKEAYVYQGIPVEPNVSVYHGISRLRLGTDYKISFKNNKGAGTGEIIVTGKGNYSGNLVQEFKITAEKAETDAVSLKKAKIDKLPAVEYTGNQIQPTPVVRLDGSEVSAAEYNVSYSKNTDKGTATVIVSGDGIHTKDAVKTTFKINPLDLSKAGSKLQIEVKEAVYSASGAKPEVTVTLTENGNTWTLREGTDYKLTFKNNKAVAKATDAKAPTVKVTGMGNFKGSAPETPFTINSADLGDQLLNVPDVVFKKDQKKASAYQTKAVIYGAEDLKALKANKDYTVEFEDLTAGIVLDGKTTAEDLKTVKEGDLIKVTATAKEGSNYIGSVTDFYTLRAAVKDIAKAAVTITPATYSGSPQKPEMKVSFKDGKTSVPLTEGTDYTAYFLNNLKKGTGTAVLSGLYGSGYSGCKFVKFKVNAADADAAYAGVWNGTGFDTGK